MKTKFFALFSFFLFGIFTISYAQDIAGRWKTVDDETGKVKSIVKIYKVRNGKYFGKVEKLFIDPKYDQNPKCVECSGQKKDKPIIGMIIITNIKKTEDNMWENGEILDPENGKTYDCKIWLEDGKLIVRGFLGISLLGRSQTWLKVK